VLSVWVGEAHWSPPWRLHISNGRGGGDITRCRGRPPPGPGDASHLVVRVELAAVDVVVVPPERREQLPRVDGVRGHRALARHEHQLRAAAARHGELEPLATPVGHLPVVYLRDTRGAEGEVQAANGF